MISGIGKLLSSLPGRRPRHWRYVSPNRRSVGAVVLGLLVASLVAYWVMPRLMDRWTRAEAVAYLRSITGGRVKIDSARFSLFGGIEVGGVKLDAPNSPPGEHLFVADSIVLRHRPWSLIFEGRLEPTEIICSGSELSPGVDTEGGGLNFQELIDQVQKVKLSGDGSSGSAPLPIIAFRGVRLHVLGAVKLLDLSMVPEGRKYRIEVEQRPTGPDTIHATWRLDLDTGDVELVKGTVPRLADTDTLLPEQYQWRKNYNLQGKVVLKGRRGQSPNSPAYLDAELHNVSLQFLAEQGGMKMTEVNGTLTFDANGVEAKDLVGRLPQAGDARFRLKGWYGGYDANSRLNLTIQAENMTVPDPNTATAWLADTLRHIQRAYKPGGRFDLDANVCRDANGAVTYGGFAVAKGMTATYVKFPYGVTDVSGKLRFRGDANGQWAFLEGMEGRHGEVGVRVSGKADLVHKKGPHDITVVATGGVLDEQLRAAIPEKYHHAWDNFSPAGRMDARVRVRKASLTDKEYADITLIMDGRASMSYAKFPYRLDGLVGQVRVDDDKVYIDSVKGRRGTMYCTVDGTFSGLKPGQGSLNLSVDATNVPLDSALIAALPERSRARVSPLKLTGLAPRVSGWIRQQRGEPLDFKLTAEMKGGSLQPPWVHSPLEDASGTVTIRPTHLAIDSLRARYVGQHVQAAGQVLLDANEPRLNLRLNIPAARFEEGVCKSLPESVQKAWRRLTPSGRGEVELLLRAGLDSNAGELDYRLTVDANGMGLVYEDFPYALTGIRGKAVVTPAGVRLSRFTGLHGAAVFHADGNMVITPEAETLEMELHARAVAIDRDFLAAIPKTLAPLARRFEPGGSCDVHFRRLRIVTPARDPNAEPEALSVAELTSGSARRSGGSWLVDGNVSFAGATVDIGLGHKTLTGSVRGMVSQAGDDLSADAAVELASVRVGSQELTNLSGRLIKKPGGKLMRLTDLQGRTHGGQVAGFAEVRLNDPMELGLSLSVRGIRLEDMFAAINGAKPTADQKVKGLLTGNLQFSSIESDKPRRQASGVLKITKGELIKLPVMLGLLNVLYMQLPGNTAFTDGELTYHMRNDELIFDEIYFHGPGLSIVGSGRMDVKTEKLSLTFLSGPPKKLPRLGALSEMLEGIAREVAEIRVDGTIAKPRMRTMPLRSLDHLLRELSNPGKK